MAAMLGTFWPNVADPLDVPSSDQIARAHTNNLNKEDLFRLARNELTDF